MSDDLVTWLRAQLDDDERRAKEASTQRAWWIDEAGDRVVRDTTRRIIAECPDADDAAHIAGWGPKRVLAEVNAKRRILDLHEYDQIDVSLPGGPPETMPGRRPPTAGLVLRLLALPYADRPGYRDEWKP